VRTRRWTGRGIARRANELTDSRKVRAEGSRRRDDSLMPGQTQVTVPRVPILYLHHRPELGGAPRSLSYLLENLDTERFEPHVYCPGGPAAELFADCGAQVHIGPTATFTHIWASSYHGRRWALLGVEAARLHPHLAELRRLLRIYRFPLVHLNDSPLVAAAWHVHRSRIALIWHLRGPLAGAENIRSRAIRMCVRAWADRAIAINDVVAESFADVPQTEVIFNSADLELFRPGDPRAARAAHGLDPERPAVGFFSYIYELKGYVDFIEAARICKDRGLEAQFLIVGSGVRDPMYFRTVRGRTLRSAGLLVDHERHARELVRTYKLDEVVRFIPYTRAPESLYVACDVVAAPSRGPELGRSVIEAAASGRPSVVTAPHGGGVVIPGETGLLATAASPNSLADALERLLKSDELRNRMGVNARRHAEENFDPARNAARIMRLYSDLIPARRVRRAGAGRRQLRILFVTPYFAPAWGFGGPPRVAWDLTRGLARRGHKVRVLTTDALDDGRRASAGYELLDGVEVIRFRNLSNQLAWRAKKFVPPGLVHAVFESMKEFDFVHVTETRTVPTAAAFLACRHAGRPLAISAHGSLPESTGLRGLAKRAYDALLVHPMLDEAALLCAQTTHEASLYAELGGRASAIDLLPLPIDFAAFDPLPERGAFRERIGLDKHDHVVLFLGRLHHLKGVDVLMDAVRIARAEDRQLKLVIAGRDDGAWKGLLRTYRDEFEQGAFVFVGPVYGRERIEAYVGCDVFSITPRLWEETSLAALEAAASMRPVVVTPQAEIPELETAGAGLIPSLDPAAIANALLKALDGAESMGPAARALVERNHRVETVVERLEMLYTQRVLGAEVTAAVA